jgi:hypothetical protein
VSQEKPKELWKRLNRLSYHFGYNTPEARALCEAADIVRQASNSTVSDVVAEDVAPAKEPRAEPVVTREYAQGYVDGVDRLYAAYGTSVPGFITRALEGDPAQAPKCTCIHVMPRGYEGPGPWHATHCPMRIATSRFLAYFDKNLSHSHDARGQNKEFVTADLPKSDAPRQHFWKCHHHPSAIDNWAAGTPRCCQ